MFDRQRDILRGYKSSYVYIRFALQKSNTKREPAVNFTSRIHKFLTLCHILGRRKKIAQLVSNYGTYTQRVGIIKNFVNNKDEEPRLKPCRCIYIRNPW